MGKDEFRGREDYPMEMDFDLDEENWRKMKKTKKEAVEVEMEMGMEIEDVHHSEIDGSHVVLPKTVLRVLLVEADDSTRRIISALLRKCCYRVSAVPDGLKAWETLNGRPHSVDLILTEVDLPSISGYALLTLVTEHDICKNIPVIMMSSCDTVSMVLKCMLKGAADFLIKPIRKNELKNLWQHVWRRHTIGGKVPMNFAGRQHKVEATFDNDEASYHSCDRMAAGKKSKECGEKDSDAQSSCTTPYLEAESGWMPKMQGLLAMKDGAAPNMNMEHGFSAYMEKEFDILKCNIKEKSDNEACDSMSSRMKYHVFTEISNQNVVVRPDSSRVNADSSCEINGYNSELVESSSGVIDLIGQFDDNQKQFNRISTYTDINTVKVEFSPQLELSLRRICPVKLKNQEDEKSHALNRSNASAFSSYNSCKIMKPPSLTLSNALTISDTCASESSRPLQSPLSGNSGCTSQENGVPANNNQNSTSAMVACEFDQAERQVQQPQPALLPGPDSIFEEKTYAGHILPSTFYTSLPGMSSIRSTRQPEQSPISSNASFHQSCCDISYSRPVYHQHEETISNSVDRVVKELKHDSPAVTHSGSSSLCNGTDHINSNAHGSICSQTEGYNTSSSTMVVEKTAASENMNSTVTLTYEGCKELDPHRSRLREAALEKFRLKRKDRCYEKKVRYQSRKRLAEQRPRVKGQFVRQQQRIDQPFADAGGQ